MEKVTDLTGADLAKADLRVSEQLARVFARQFLSKNNFQWKGGESCQVRWTNSLCLTLEGNLFVV